MTAFTGSNDCSPARLAVTRAGLHRIAEHVLAAEAAGIPRGRLLWYHVAAPVVHSRKRLPSRDARGVVVRSTPAGLGRFLDDAALADVAAELEQLGATRALHTERLIRRSAVGEDRRLQHRRPACGRCTPSRVARA